MHLTWKQLEKAISKMDSVRKQDNVAVYVPDMDEFFPVDDIYTSGEDNDVLDLGHKYLMIP